MGSFLVQLNHTDMDLQSAYEDWRWHNRVTSAVGFEKSGQVLLAQIDDTNLTYDIKAPAHYMSRLQP